MLWGNGSKPPFRSAFLPDVGTKRDLSLRKNQAHVTTSGARQGGFYIYIRFSLSFLLGLSNDRLPPFVSLPPHTPICWHTSQFLSPTPALAHRGMGPSPTLEQRYGNVITSLMDGAMSRYMCNGSGFSWSWRRWPWRDATVIATRCQDGTFSAIQQQEERTRLSIQEISQLYKGRVRRTAFGCLLSIARSFVTVGCILRCSVL